MNKLYIDILTWLNNQNLLEILGVSTGILCVYLAAKNTILSWPIAIISSAVYIIIFMNAKLYADMVLQVYFIITSCYGWYFWSHKSKSIVLVSSITKKGVLFSATAIVTVTTLLGFILENKTDASFPWIDSFCTACSIVATILLARKVMENWLIWIFVDIIYVGVYIDKDLHNTAAMYTFYIYIAALGYLNWKKEFRLQNRGP